jgi:hypothetical protein
VARIMNSWCRFGIVCLTLSAVGCGNSRPAQEPPQTVEAEHSADLEPFLRSYFETWSRGDMEGYRDHFHEQAMIYLVKNGRVLVAMPRDPFVDGQEAARSSSEAPGVETMTSFTADEDRHAATVNAQWELIEGEERTVGVDRFTLIRDHQWSWKIVALVYYATGRGRASSSGDERSQPPREAPGPQKRSSE